MRKTHTPLISFIRQSRLVRTLGFGTLCSLSAFVIGMQTAGEVHTVDTIEAAAQVQSNDSSGRVPLKGDIDADGILTVDDALRIHTFTEGYETPTPDDIRRGDMDGDFELTSKDVGRALYALSGR